jgi:decaprenylphospho-beta-D-ribofuranose 2-oxidase
MDQSRRTVPLCGWGRYPINPCRLLEPTPGELTQTVAGSPTLIARGNGRGYGDCAVNTECTISMLRCDDPPTLDTASGVLSCAAGTVLVDIIERFVPLGWFPPVTPGTKFVTIGGMVAADVHGKNHHLHGSFGSHVISLDLALADGQVLHCSREQNAELFAATLGGMGLTGVILRCDFKMLPIQSRMIRRVTMRARDLDEVLEQFEATQGSTYSVAWIDSLGRGAALGRSVLQLGEHAQLDDLPASARLQPLYRRDRRPRRVPVDFPAFVLNTGSIRLFNALYYARAKPGQDLVDFDPFFYPLDTVLDWNRIYGSRGFFQYQCVVPLDTSRAALRSMLGRLPRAGAGSFLSVLKRLGHQSGLLSFPMEGYTLALDLPVNPTTLAVAADLDAIVKEHGGRLYLAKDARMPAAMLRQYPALDRFRAVRRAADPNGKFSSAMSQRLGL